ncbi:MAG TPA: polyamine aminopropyltransferase [Candidatus Eremiobacteraeota bacterium]|nr:MAG: Spermidine synthase [bacterium ADurb.Bin363]HPZ06572.1 polyamine aminopropyltransferase [Candidatus Eremiobacteraeota bacterium]
MIEAKITENPIKKEEEKEQLLLLVSVFFISLCGISYELLFGTISSYLIGDTVLQFSLTIGIFMSAMGLGSYLSKYIETNLLDKFIIIEIWIAIIGGFSAFILFFAFAYTEIYSFFMYFCLIIIGTLIGLEIPIVTRIIQQYGTLKITLARVFSLDYLGALAASILFPLTFLPYLGLMASSFFFGLLNIGVTAANIIYFYNKLTGGKRCIFWTLIAGILLLTGLIFSYKIVSLAESALYQADIVYTKQTKYQRIIVTKWKEEINLFLDGNLQFCSLDEYRYHETLVHPAITMSSSRENILLLGGGDGLALREILKYKDVKTITLVDIDPEMIELCSTHPLIVSLNKNSLKDTKVKYIAQDAWKFINDTDKLFDVIIIDLPDPGNEKLSKLYSNTFYNMLGHHLSRGGIIAVQSTSTFFSTKTFWCIYNTIEKAGFHVKPIHTLVPSFGDWGFVLASNEKPDPGRCRIEVPLKYLNEETMKSIFHFSEDIQWRETMVNTLDNSIVTYYYNEDWSKWNEND